MGRGAAVGINVEYQPGATIAAAAVGLMVEYQPGATIAAAAVGLMVEYSDEAVPTNNSAIGVFPQESLSGPWFQGHILKRRRGSM